MNKCISIIFIAVCAVMASCSKTAPNIFGTIPSIYENHIFRVAQAAQQANASKGIGAGKDIILSQAPLAYDSASVEAEPQVKQLVGCEVNATIGTDLEYEYASKVKISEVSLPTFSPSHSGPEFVTIDFDLNNATDVARIYYFLCSETDTIDCGFVDVVPVQEGKLHVTAKLKAPNIPAEYQEKINTFRIVSEENYGFKKLFVDGDQKDWREEYNNRLNGRKSAMPVK